MAIASDIRPGDDPGAVSEKLVGRTRTWLLSELFGYFDIPAEFINHVFGNLNILWLIFASSNKRLLL